MPDCNGFATVTTTTTMPKTKHPEDPMSPQLVGVKKACLSPSPIIIISSPEGSTSSPSAKGRRKKSVSFKEHSLAEVIEFEDDLDSKNARQMFWEFVAVDRHRFLDRVQRMEPLLAPVLTVTHRNGIYASRMGNLSPSPLPPSPSPSLYQKLTLEMEVETIVETVVKTFMISTSGSNLREAASSSAA